MRQYQSEYNPNLNTSHVKLQHRDTIKNKWHEYDLNTSHVKLQHNLYT